VRHFGQFVHAEPYATIDEVFRAPRAGRPITPSFPFENSTEAQ
jgi:hypothetical protein